MKMFFLCGAALLALSACNEKTGNHADLTGQWNGPEGTYLKIEPIAGAEAYDIRIRNLDGETAYTGMDKDGTITFEREGQSETIRKGSGDDTGMKWLAGKKDCLVVKSGEGYCRD